MSPPTSRFECYTDPGHPYTLVKVLQSYAPNLAAQEICSLLVADAIADNVSGPGLDLILASAIVDGLRYGNWPWTSKPDAHEEKHRSRNDDSHPISECAPLRCGRFEGDEIPTDVKEQFRQRNLIRKWRQTASQ